MTQRGIRADARHGQVFRRDIEGMPALAVLLLLLGHVGLSLVPGGFVGADVFFVLWGFVITGLLVDDAERTGRIAPIGVYARQARRLLPAAGLVLVLSLPLAFFLLPKSRWAQTGWDVVASGFSAMNWRLAEQTAGPSAAGAGSSMLQHFWVLAVAGQFLLVWPMLLLLFGGIARRWTSYPRWSLLVGIGPVAVCSFVWSGYLAQAEPGRAYLATTTRLWEFALGAALAVLSPRLVRLPGWVGALVGWLGLGAVILAALALDPATDFSGYPVLLPALGAAAIIAGGAPAGRSGAARLGPVAVLGSRPVRALGAVAYALYLWHWPLLVVAQARFGGLEPVAALGVVLFAAAPAVLTYRYVQRPIGLSTFFTGSPAQAIRLGTAAIAVPVLAGLFFQFTVWPPPQAPLPAAFTPGAGPTTPGGTPSARPVARGAAVLDASPRGDRAGAPVDKVSTITPDPRHAGDDLSDAHRHNCLAKPSGTRVLTCFYGKREAEFTVALAGDAQAADWVPALQVIAKEHGWRLITYLRSGCPFLDVRISVGGDPQPACAEWFGEVRRELTGERRPDLLVTANYRYPPMRDGRTLTDADRDTELVEGMRRTWKAMRTAKVPTVLLREPPRPSLHVAECVAQNPTRLTRCAAPRADALAAGGGPVQEAAAKGQKGVRLIDLNNAICPTDRCAAVIGGVLVYRDAGNLTATYARTLAPRLGAALDQVTN